MRVGSRSAGYLCNHDAWSGAGDPIRWVQAGLRGMPQRRRWRTKPSGTPPAGTRNHLERNFTATAPNANWVTDSTSVRTAEHWLNLCLVLICIRARGGLVHECAARLPACRPSGPHGYLGVTHPHPGHSAFRSRVPVYIRRVPALLGSAPHY